MKATPYIWVLSKSVAQGGAAKLYAYFRRLPDWTPQEAKPVTFRVDGTVIGAVATDQDGIARYPYLATEPPGSHTIRCEFAGDAWVEAGYGEGVLTVM